MHIVPNLQQNNGGVVNGGAVNGGPVNKNKWKEDVSNSDTNSDTVYSPVYTRPYESRLNHFPCVCKPD